MDSLNWLGFFLALLSLVLWGIQTRRNKILQAKKAPEQVDFEFAEKAKRLKEQVDTLTDLMVTNAGKIRQQDRLILELTGDRVEFFNETQRLKEEIKRRDDKIARLTIDLSNCQGMIARMGKFEDTGPID